MNLEDAFACSANDTASLTIKDEHDPCHRGQSTDYGINFMWISGHLVPLTFFGFTGDRPSGTADCDCGHESHDAWPFPNDPDLWDLLRWDERWEPMFPIDPLTALGKTL